LLEGKHDAVFVASDLIAREVAAGQLDDSKWRVIKSSPTFPPLCFGVRHNLDPGLRARVQKAFEQFQFEGTSVGNRFKGTASRFAPVDYKKDWEFVRQIDATLTRIGEEIK
jgi:phosphonate transport system substrate-binding protein